MEDDGVSLGYEEQIEASTMGTSIGRANLNGAVRRTAFQWSDATKTLSWVVAGDFVDAHVFVHMVATFDATASRAKSSGTIMLGHGGHYNF